MVAADLRWAPEPPPSKSSLHLDLLPLPFLSGANPEDNLKLLAPRPQRSVSKCQDYALLLQSWGGSRAVYMLGRHAATGPHPSLALATVTCVSVLLPTSFSVLPETVIL